jgi:Leucine-rich repeat (LRR) protein
MEQWLTEILESERDSMFQNDSLNLVKQNIYQIDWIPENRYRILLANNRLERLPTLHKHISHLDVRNNSLHVLPLLPRRLQWLSVCYNPITQLPDLPSKLKVLKANSCQLTELPEIPLKLEVLDVGYNHIRLLPPMPEGLDTLIVNNNLITDFSYLPTSLRVLTFYGNPGLAKYEGLSINQIRLRVNARLAQQRTQAIKEELVAAAWHPRRVERWLSLGAEVEDL